jgi:hypothetical protein
MQQAFGFGRENPSKDPRILSLQESRPRAGVCHDVTSEKVSLYEKGPHFTNLREDRDITRSSPICHFHKGSLR